MRQVIYTSCAGPGHQGRQARQCPMARQRRAPLNRTLLIISVGLYCQTVYITIVYIQLYFNPPGRKLSINLCQIITFTLQTSVSPLLQVLAVVNNPEDGVTQKVLFKKKLRKGLSLLTGTIRLVAADARVSIL